MSPSIWQILIVLAIIVLFFGANRIPQLGKSLGQAIRGFKKGITEDPEIDVTSTAEPEQITDSDATKASTKQKKEETKA